MEFPWHRISMLPLEDALFLMDRNSGRWTFASKDVVSLVKLLPLPAETLPEDIIGRRDDLIASMRRSGLGEAVPARRDTLNTVILKLTKACNYGCRYCYDMEPEDAVTHMSLEIAVSIMEEAISLGTEGITIILHGGEPTLLFPLIKEIVLAGEAIAERAGTAISFCGQTNLSRLDAEMVEFFQVHRVSWGVSLDGSAELNDKFRVLRDGTGTYVDFKRSLDRFPSFVKSCGVLSTITSSNDSELLAVARHFRDVGMYAWDWSLFQPVGMGRTQASQLAFSIKKVISSWNELFDAVCEGEFDGFVVDPIVDYLRNFFVGSGKNMCLRQGCGAARDLLSIGNDGVIEACDCIDRKGPLANLGLVQIGDKDSLQRARTSDRAQLIRSRDVELGKCGSCIWLAVCGGTCMAHADSLNGVWEDECSIAMNAFTRIAHSVSHSDRLLRYIKSLQGPMYSLKTIQAAGVLAQA
ncbi:MAG TPA: radical SAM protein [Acidisarcina sp.]